MSNKAPVPRADAKLIAETCVDLADKVLYWKDRALRAEEAERKFASEVYASPSPSPSPIPLTPGAAA